MHGGQLADHGQNAPILLHQSRKWNFCSISIYATLLQFFFFLIDDTNRIWKKFSIPLDSSCPMWVFPDLKKNYETSRILLTLIPSQMCVYTYLICLNFIYIYIYILYLFYFHPQISLSLIWLPIIFLFHFYFISVKTTSLGILKHL